MDLITAYYKAKDCLIVINLEQMVLAMAREGLAGRDDEEEGVLYTSFLMTSKPFSETALDTLLPYNQFLDIMQVPEDEPEKETDETEGETNG